MCLVRALERLGSVALSKEEPDIGAAFLKFSVVTKELSALMKTLVSKWDGAPEAQNSICYTPKIPNRDIVR